MQAARDIAQRNDWDPQWVQNLLSQARMLPAIVQAAAPAPAGTPKNWAAYRNRFIEPKRIQAGARFWRANRETLARAEAQTGVPAAIVVAIIGVETLYGQHTGNYRVIDALSTLSFDFPTTHPRSRERAAYFLSELEAYLRLTLHTQTDPLALRGSYAGAMGLPQFMPSSWSRYAVDYDGDKRIDLFHSHADVIGSVANYFQTFQWQRGMPTHYLVEFEPARLDLATLLVPDIRPTFSAQALHDKGVIVQNSAVAHTGPLALVALENGSAPTSYVAGTENFFALTRYNWSSYYTMAVIELGQAITEVLETSPTASTMPK